MSDCLGTSELRLIDANANRAREGIRTAEDYVRFISGERRWAMRLKETRHSISQLLNSHFSNRQLTAGRDVAGDPLSPGATAEEVVPAGGSSKAVAMRGLKRAEEALRVLEEYTTIGLGAAAVQFARHRFALYEAEQWLEHVSEAAAVVESASLYVILTKSLCRLGLLETAAAVLRGGARLVQFRSKSDGGNDCTLLREARDLRVLCARHGAVLICNDRLDVALAAEAAGVHLGQDDIPPVDARRIVGEKVIIGRSTHSQEQARHAVEVEQADYLGVGSVYETTTKQERILAGVALAERVCAMGLGVPVFAIGGITLDRLAELKAAGVKRVAVSSAIAAAPDPETTTRRFIERMAA